MFLSSRKLRLFYLSTIAWSVLCLLFAGEIAYKVLGSDDLPQLAGTWLLLSAGPALPALWLWVMERSPWTLGFLAPTGLFGLALSLLTFNERSLQDISPFILLWSSLVIFNAKMLKSATSISMIAWKKTAPVARIPILIDHGMYLRLVDDQAIAGFPNVMRVRQHFIETIPEVIPSLREHEPIPTQVDLSSQLGHVKTFMIGKLSCEFAFLCALSFYERMCGPDFRLTKQYKSLLEEMIRIDAVPNEGHIEGLGEKATKAVTIPELEMVASTLDEQRESDRARGGLSAKDTDVTISLAALRLLMKHQLWHREENEEPNHEFPQTIKEGMNKIRESFSRQKTEIIF